ncbi:tyrosine--tRNA ligase [bacterium]|nr:MAG: tyrosine--tRNA ligase [bacterium]QQR62118.1 MAG: tyrosine--tRNA ligase [bacterium]
MKQLDVILQGTAQVTPREQLIKKLQKNVPLKIKLGMDPTAPDLHLGHAVVLKKMRQFQDLGHEAILIIGDFTAQIGDPTGRSKTRPALSLDDIKRNQETYLQQATKILSKTRLTIVNNGEWLSKLTFTDIVKLAAKTTVARIVEREDFQARLAAQQPIGLHELLYPLMQAYDSVMIQADVELGGTDQTFNLLMGRFLQEQYGQEAQVVLTMPLLEGLDGVQKMSKSYGNSIGIAEEANQMFGKLMSIPDTVMFRYFNLLGLKTEAETNALHMKVSIGDIHPMELKKELARLVVAQFHSLSAAQQAQHAFEKVFQNKEYTHARELVVPGNFSGEIWIVDLLKLAGVVQTSSQAKRLIESRAVQLNGSVIDDFKAVVMWDNEAILKAGKVAIFKLIKK